MRVFLSYSRRDTAIADRMVSDLEAHGFEVDIDRRDLPYGEEWQVELGNFIHRADTIVWLASEASVASKWCKWELGEAQRASKRLVPVRISPLAPRDLPEALGRIHILPAEGIYDPALHLNLLVEALETDRAWMETHTRLADRASEWISRARSADRLLRGKALRDAEEWRDSKPERAPAPSADTLDLLLQSRRAATRGLRVLVGLSAVGFVAMAGLAGYAVWQAGEADRQRGLVQNALIETERQEGLATYNATVGLNAMAETSRLAGNSTESALLALAAWPRGGDAGRPMMERTLRTLSNVLPFVRETHRVEFQDGFHDVRYAEGSERVAILRRSDYAIEIWNEDLTQRLRTIGDPTLKYYNAIPSPDGKLVATKTSDGSVSVYELDTARLVGKIEPLASLFDNMAFSTDSTRLLVVLDDNSVVLWDIAANAVVTRIPPQESIIGVDTFASDDAWLSADGRQILTILSLGTKIWDVNTGQMLQQFGGVEAGQADQDAAIFAARFLRGTSRLVTTSLFTPNVRLWDTETGRVLQTEVACPAGSTGSGIEMAPDHRYFTVRCSENAQLTVFDAQTFASKAKLPPADIGGRTVFSLDGERFATLGIDALTLWQTATGEEIARSRGHTDGTTGLAFTRRGNILTSSWDGTARLWDFSNRTTWRELATLMEYPASYGLSLAADHSSLYGLDDFAAVAVSLRDGTSTPILSDHELEYFRAARGGRFAFADMFIGDQWLLYDIEAEEVIRTFTLDSVRRGVPAPDGKSVALISSNELSVWSADGTRLWTQATDSTPGMVDISNDGTRLVVTGMNDRKIEVRDLATGALIAQLAEIDGSRPDYVTFSPDGKTVGGTGYMAGAIWDANTGQLVRELLGWEWGTSLAFSHDGTRVVTTDDYSAVLWDTATGMALGRYGTTVKDLSWAAFTPDDASIVTAADSGEIRIWPVGDSPAGNGLEIACARLGDPALLTSVATSFGLAQLVPICVPGHEPLAPDFARLADITQSTPSAFAPR